MDIHYYSRIILKKHKQKQVPEGLRIIKKDDHYRLAMNE